MPCHYFRGYKVHKNVLKVIYFLIKFEFKKIKIEYCLLKRSSFSKFVLKTGHKNNLCHVIKYPFKSGYNWQLWPIIKTKITVYTWYCFWGFRVQKKFAILTFILPKWAKFAQILLKVYANMLSVFLVWFFIEKMFILIFELNKIKLIWPKIAIK